MVHFLTFIYFITVAGSMTSTSRKIFINLRKLSKSKALWATGIATSLGAGICYIDENNGRRFNERMVNSLYIY